MVNFTLNRGNLSNISPPPLPEEKPIKFLLALGFPPGFLQLCPICSDEIKTTTKPYHSVIISSL